MLRKMLTPRVLFPFFMAIAMALIMSGVMTLLNLGLHPHFFYIWIKNFVIGFCCAFPVAFLLAPKVNQLVSFVCKK